MRQGVPEREAPTTRDRRVDACQFSWSSELVAEYPLPVFGYYGGTHPGYRRQGENMSTTEYQVTGMTCGHCEMSVREEVSQIAGVDDIQVSAQTGRLVVSATQSVADSDVLAAVSEAGYSAVRI
jgi:copper chaperone